MRSQTRSEISTVLLLTLYVGVAPFILAGGVMWIGVKLGAGDDWGIFCSVLYLIALWIGATRFAAHFERRGG